MRFTKMHGCGNDYVFVDCFDETVADAPALARAMSDRHTGVGSDGLILICPSRGADVRMEMYNADGSRGRLCGNALRCVAQYAHEHGLLKARAKTDDSASADSQDVPWSRALRHLRRPDEKPEPASDGGRRHAGMVIETDAGPLPAAILVDRDRAVRVCADLGRPGLEPRVIPSTLQRDRIVEHPLVIGGNTYHVTCVAMGSPHAVVFVHDVEGVDLGTVGPQFEHAPVFPDRINVHFARVASRESIRIRTWERGSGITQACGTGAAAVCVAGVLTERSERRVEIHMPGGTLAITWDDDDHVYMTGPAVEVFTGEWNLRG